MYSDQPTGRLALVFELMDMNIYELIRGRRHYVAEERVKSYMYQLIKAMDHMHRNGIFHRSIVCMFENQIPLLLQKKFKQYHRLQLLPSLLQVL